MDKVVFISTGILFILCCILPRDFVNKMREKGCELLDFKKLRITAIYTTFFMVVAHVYAWLNGSFLIDTAFIYRGMTEKIQASDKWAQQFFISMLDAGVNLPWFAGVLATCFMLISVYCIVDILEINSKWGIILISGLCSINSAIICQQEYSGGNYTGEVALAFACVAAWIGRKSNINIYLRTVLMTVFIALSSGTYGSYVSIVPSLFLVVLILDIFDGNDGKTNWKNAFLYLFQFIIGMLLYYVILRLIMFSTSTQLNSYMGEDILNDTSGFYSMLNCIPAAYKYLFEYYLTGHAEHDYLPHFMGVLLFLIMLTGSLLTMVWMYRRRECFKDRKWNLPLLLLILSVLPMAINLIYIMSAGNVHYLMIFTYIVPLLFFVKALEDIWKDDSKKENANHKDKRLAVFMVSLFCIFIYYSIVMANAVYTKYHNMYDVSLSIGTRILDRIETCEGFEGTEEIILLGKIQENKYFGEIYEEAEILDAFLGCGNPSNINGLNYGFRMMNYLCNILDSKMEYSYYEFLEQYISVSEGNLSRDEISVLNAMQVFPQKESVKKIGNKIYVKFSDI